MRLAVLIASLVVLLTVSCTSNTTPPETGARSGINPVQPGFDIPFPGKEREATGVITDIEALGRETWDRSPAATEDGDSLVLAAPAGEYCYAIYQFQTGAFPFDRVYFDLSEITVPQKVWIGVANYGLGGAGRWEWTMYTAGMGYLEVNWSSMRGAAGYAYLAIVTHGFAVAKVNRSYIQVDMPTWDIHTVDNLNSPGETCAMVRLGNLPSIIYERGDGIGGYELVIAKSSAMKPMSDADWTVNPVDSGYPGPIRSVAAAQSSGNPVLVVAYEAPGPNETYVVYGHGKNSFPAAFSEWYWSELDIGWQGDSLGLAIIDGNPAVAYEGLGTIGGSAVYYNRATKAVPETGSDWGTQVIAGLDYSISQNYVGINLFSLGDPGRPALLYYDQTFGDLQYAYSEMEMPGDTTDFTFASVDGIGIGEVSSGVEFSTRPAVFYIDASGGLVKYARGTQVDPTGTGDFYQRHVIDRGASGGWSSGELDVTRLSLGMGIVYRDFATGAVMYAWDEGGTPGSGSAWKIVTVDPRETTGEIKVIMMQDQNPGICYHTVSPDALQFAQMVP